MVGYLLVRGGVHIVAYAKALEKLTGVDVGKLLPIPDISNKRVPRGAEARGQGPAPHPLPLQSRRLQARSGEIWNGTHPEDGSRWSARTARPKASRRRTSPRSRSSRRR